jgi:plasmid stabilization system protein ParE
MGRISYSSQALADLERITDFLLPEGTDLVLSTLDLIDEAIGILERHPLTCH